MSLWRRLWAELVDQRLGGPRWRALGFAGSDWWTHLPDPMWVPTRPDHPHPQGYLPEDEAWGSGAPPDRWAEALRRELLPRPGGEEAWDALVTWGWVPPEDPDEPGEGDPGEEA